MGRIDREFEPQAGAAGFAPAGITMTDGAVARLRQMLDDEGEADLKLRMYVTGGGCAGMQYGVGASSIMSHRADREVSQGWKPVCCCPAVGKCSCPVVVELLPVYAVARGETRRA